MGDKFNVYAERPDKGTTIQNPSVALVCIDSADMFQSNKSLTTQTEEYSSFSPYNSLIYKKQALVSGSISRVALTEVCFNWAVPTINGRNDRFLITLYSAVPPAVNTYEVTLVPGWYNFTDLAAQLQTQLNVGEPGIAGTFTVTIDPDTFFFKIKYVPAGGETWNNMRIEINALSTMLGFNGQTYSEGALNTLEIVGNFPSLTYTPYIDIVSQRLTKNQAIYDNSSSSLTPVRSLLSRIYLAPIGIVPRTDEDTVIGRCPFTISKEFAYPKQIAWEPTENIDSVDLLILDNKGVELFSDPVFTDGTVMFVGNSGTFQLTLQVSEN